MRARWMVAGVSVGLLLLGLRAWGDDVRDPPPNADSGQYQWALDVSHRMHVLTVTNQTPHGRLVARRGRLLLVNTSTNTWLMVNISDGSSRTANWAAFKKE